jgi:thioredoxin-like negative regulator of GroEL
LEEEYKDQVNFVMVNGDRSEAWPLIERFGVDAIPHLALISAEGDVETALIGPVPKRVLEADLNALISNANAQNKKVDLPYQMLDAFSERPGQRRVHFDSSESTTK